MLMWVAGGALAYFLLRRPPRRSTASTAAPPGGVISTLETSGEVPEDRETVLPVNEGVP